MNVVQAIQFYINNMVSNIQGMKVFLLDKETTGVVSMVYTQSQILQKEVFLFEKVDQANREVMGHLKAVCFVRPTEENIKLLKDELSSPKYGEYHIFFSNTLKNVLLEELAQADEHEVVKEVQEYFADYYAVNNDFFSFNIEGVTFTDSQITRITDGISSVLLSLKKRPYIRYQNKSNYATRVAQELMRRMNQETELFEFRRTDVPPLLLILDRRDDPVTPLLMQWTYQAMVHELLTLTNNRVDMRNVPGVRDDLKEIVLSPESDSFYKQNMYANFGDLGVSVKQLVDEYQDKSKNNTNVQTIDDMKRFVENYADFRKMAGNVSKHVAIMGELSRLMDLRSLMDVSELEQELACNQSPNEAFTRVMTMIENPNINKWDKLKLALLYSIRYESAGRLPEVVDALSRNGEQADMIGNMSLYGGQAVRAGDLFGSKNIFTHVSNIKKAVGLQGITNIYSQHKPLLNEILDQLSKNKLKDSIYSFITGQPTPTRPTDVIVFVVGGVTYEEAQNVYEFNNSKDNNGMRVVLGGTSIQNSHTFIRDVGKAAKENAPR
eukprot:Phypoly_transcript_06049.p1 GENE.Phypoly_transcript_06049~~Phypoly_transcript_06049.p1  ORF type:complete len:564 (+),score=108.74 Phypoly_transcript_06049:40-1692(+)